MRKKQEMVKKVKGMTDKHRKRETYIHHRLISAEGKKCKVAQDSIEWDSRCSVA